MYGLLLHKEGQGQERGKGGYYSGKLIIFEANNNNNSNNNNIFSI